MLYTRSLIIRQVPNCLERSFLFTFLWMFFSATTLFQCIYRKRHYSNRAQLIQFRLNRSDNMTRHTIPSGLIQGPQSPNRSLYTSSCVRLPVSIFVAVHIFHHMADCALACNTPRSATDVRQLLWLLAIRFAWPLAQKLETSGDLPGRRWSLHTPSPFVDNAIPAWRSVHVS